MMPTTANTPYSSSYWMPMGAPSATIRRSGSQARASRRSGKSCGLSERHATTRSSASITQRLTEVAHAEPIAPAAGNPRFP